MLYQKEGASTKYKKLASILADSTIVAQILLFIMKLTSDWEFLDYINILVKSIFIIGLIIDGVPNFLKTYIYFILIIIKTSR